MRPTVVITVPITMLREQASELQQSVQRTMGPRTNVTVLPVGPDVDVKVVAPYTFTAKDDDLEYSISIGVQTFDEVCAFAKWYQTTLS